MKISWKSDSLLSTAKQLHIFSVQRDITPSETVWPRCLDYIDMLPMSVMKLLKSVAIFV